MAQQALANNLSIHRARERGGGFFDWVVSPRVGAEIKVISAQALEKHPEKTLNYVPISQRHPLLLTPLICTLHQALD